MGGPRKIADVMSELITRSGYARETAAGVDHATWTAVVGPQMAALTRVGEIKRGVLEIFAQSNIVVSELGFQKQQLLAGLNAKLTKTPLKDLRFKIGQLKPKT